MEPNPLFELNLTTNLKGNITLTDALHNQTKWLKEKTLYKFIWVRSGVLQLEIDHTDIQLRSHEMITLTPLHHLRFKEVAGEYLVLLFNANFYCIYGHDSEVSCNGILFNGSSNVVRLRLTESESETLDNLIGNITGEYQINDNLREEMLRILLKRFIICCTRIRRNQFVVDQQREKKFDLVRQYYVLVDQHFKEKKQVQEYANLLNRSPKTLTNLFSAYGLPSPLRIIHERIESEAKRLLLYSSKSGKEIADILGFEDLALFSRFFKNITGENISEYRKREKG